MNGTGRGKDEKKRRKGGKREGKQMRKGEAKQSDGELHRKREGEKDRWKIKGKNNGSNRLMQKEREIERGKGSER